MKIALLKSQLGNRGGLEKYALRIASSLIAKNAEVTLLTTQNSFQNLPEQISVQSFPSSSLPSFLRLENFDRHASSWLDLNKMDVIYGLDRNRTQTHLRLGNGIHAAFLKSRKLSEGNLKYAICQINPLHRTILSMEKTALENPILQKVFVNSHMVKKELLEHYATPPEKIEVVHNGVEWEEMEGPFKSWEEERAKWTNHYQLKSSGLHLLFIGNGYRRKGLDLLLKALSLWKTRDFSLSVIGKDKEIKRYQKMRDELALQQKVHFFGAQEKILPFYQMADALIIPSFYDPFANVTLEALSLGLFVVSSKSNGGSEILTPQTGAIIDDLLSIESILSSLDRIVPKTMKTASAIRSCISHLDFSKQLIPLVNFDG